MSRKVYVSTILLLLLTSLTTACQPGEPQSQGPPTPVSPTTNSYRLLIMDSQSGGHYETIREALLTGLENAGYVEGENLRVTAYTIDGDREMGEQILREELENDYDVIYVAGTLMTIAAKEVAFEEPEHLFVYVSVTDPVGVGVIDSFDSPPPANFTGVSYPVSVASRFRFIRQLMPEVERIGLVHADMPQSHSYRSWIEDLVENDPQFADLEVLFREVPLATGDDAVQTMCESARAYVEELDSQIDVFIAPNDDMGASRCYAEVVYETATHPLIGLTEDQVMEGWGATMVIYPSHVSMGTQAAEMIARLFEGEPIQDIYPESPRNNGYAFDLNETEHFDIQVPVEMIELAGDNIVR